MDQSISNLTPEEYAGLQQMKEMEGNADWDYYKRYLTLGEDKMGDAVMQQKYNDALVYLYQHVRPGSEGYSDTDSIRATAKEWWRLMNREAPPTVESVIDQINEIGGYEDEDLEMQDGRFSITLNNPNDEHDDYQFAYAVDNITGETYGPDRIDELNQKIKGDYAEQLTPEEMARYEQLQTIRGNLANEIESESSYVDLNRSIYNDSLEERDFMTNCYAAAANADAALHGKTNMDTALPKKLDYFYLMAHEEVPRITPYSVFDSAVEAGQFTRPEVTEYAVEANRNADEEIKTLTNVMADIEKADIPISEEEKKTIQGQIDALKRQQKEAGYAILDGEADFAEVAAEVSKKLSDHEIDVDLGMMIETAMTGESEADRKVSHIFGGDNIVGLLMGLKDAADTVISSNELTPEEWNRFYYLLGTDGAGKDAAQEYLNFLLDPENGMVTMRASIDKAQWMQEYAQSDPLTGFVVGRAANLLSSPSSFGYRIGQWIKGKSVNPYARQYDYQNAKVAADTGAKDAVVNALGGEESALGQLAGRAYSVTSGLADYFISRKISSAALEELAMGLNLGKFGELKNRLIAGSNKAGNEAVQRALQAGASIGLEGSELGEAAISAGFKAAAASSAGKALKYINVAEKGLIATSTAFPLAFNSAETTFRNTLLETNDETKASKMAFVEFTTSMVNHAIIFNGVHRAFNANPKDFVSGVSGFLKELGKTELAVGVSGLTTNTVEQIAEKAILDADSRWGKNYQAYYDMYKSKEIAEKMADEQMKHDIFSNTFDEMVNAAIRTGITFTFGSVKNATKEARENFAAKNAKAISLISEAHDSTPTGAAVSLSAAMNTGDMNADMAAAQTLIADVCDNNPAIASDLTLRILQASSDEIFDETIMDTLAHSILTSGVAHQQLTEMATKLKEGGQITEDDVIALNNAIQMDRGETFGEADAFEKEYQNAITENRVANETIKAASTNPQIAAADDKVKAAQEDVTKAEAKLTEANDKLAVAKQNASDAADDFLNNPSNNDNLATLQNTMAQVPAATENVMTAASAVADAMQRLRNEQAAREATQTEAMTSARVQAQSSVQQLSQEEAQTRYEQSIAKTKPIKKFGQAYTAYNENRQPVKLTGVYDINDAGIVFTTESGHLVTDASVNTSGLPQDGFWNVVNKVQDRRGGVKHPTVAPKVYFPESFPVNVNGEPVEMIGVAGKEIDGQWENPILMDIKGNLYSWEDPGIEQPFDKNDIVMDAFESVADTLEVMDNVPRVEVTTNGREAEATDLTVQGTVGEGNNAGELAEQSGQDVGLGDNGNAEHGLPASDVGGTQEGPSLDIRPPESRESARLRDLITDRIPTDENGKDAITVNNPYLQIEQDYGRFSSALDSAKAAGKNGLYVDSQSPEHLEEMGAITLLSPDGNSGVAIGTKGADKGNIVGVFNNPKGPHHGTMPYLITNALVNGGNKLDCYDGFLSDSYAKYGFVPVGKTPFNIEYAPEGWDVKTMGTPDVVAWMHNGDLPDTVARRYMFQGEENGGYHVYTDAEMAALPTFTDTIGADGKVVEGEDGYSKLLRYRDNMLATRDNGSGLTYPHAMSRDHALAFIKNGSTPAPGIAITKTGQDSGAYNFGTEGEAQNVIALFSEDTINPEKDNRVYLAGDDAFARMFPGEIIGSDDKGFYNKETGERLTSADVVEIMIQQGIIEEGITKVYKTLEEMKADVGRIVQKGSAAMEDQKELRDLDKANLAIYNDMPDEAKANFEDAEAVRSKLNENLHKIYRKDMTPAELSKALEGIGIPVSEEVAAGYKETIERAVGGLVDYFEAKLMRPLDISEAKGFVIPENDDEVAKALDEKNIPYLTHNGTNRADQVAAMQKIINDSAKTPVDKDGTPITQPPVNAEPPASTTTPYDVNAPVAAPEREGSSDFDIGQRQWGEEGAQESKVLHQKVKDHILNNNDYIKDTNEDQIDRAISWVQSHVTQSDPTGLLGAVNEIESEGFNLWSADGQARLAVAISIAADNGDLETELRLSEDYYNKVGTDLGQALQARKIFSLMTPGGRKAALRREAKKIEDEYRVQGKKVKLKISDETLEKAANAKNDFEFAEAKREMEKELAAQIPSDWRLRFRTIRMTSMLANPRTHIRNIEGNGLFIPLVELKNLIGAGLEDLMKVPIGERTKGIKRTKAQRDFAKADAEIMLPELQGEAKYYEHNKVERQRNAFGNGKSWISKHIGKRYQQFANWSSDKLEEEDALFLSFHYRRALSGYMAANNLEPKDMKGSKLSEARAYAIQEAQKATYRDANSLAKWLNNPGNSKAQFVISAVQPFVKTPLNIMRRGVEYSPVGLVNAVVSYGKRVAAYAEWEESGFKGKKPKDAMSASEVIDKIASGLTGTMLAGLGAWLASLGILKTKASDTEKLHGAQDYSLEIGGKSIGIGNVIPLNIPMFFGASMYNSLTEEADVKDLRSLFAKTLNTISDILEPVVDTTMMSSLNSLLDTTRYASDGDLTLSVLGQKILANYAASYFPSFVGAVAKVVDPTQRKAFVGSGDELSIWTAMLEQTQNKIPFLSRKNVPYVNAWGEENTTSRFNAFMQNFILPDKIQDLTSPELDDMLEDLTSITDTTVTPKSGPKTLTDDTGEKIKLTDKQWHEYATVSGQTAKATLQELIERPEFICMSDNPEVQAELVNKVYKYAKAKAAAQLFPDKLTKKSGEKGSFDSWTKNALAADNVIDYIFQYEEEKAKNEHIKEQKKSILDCLESDSLEAAKTAVNFLREAEVKESSIKSYISENVKPLYKEADEMERDRIRTFLSLLDIGYDDFKFDNWLK